MAEQINSGLNNSTDDHDVIKDEATRNKIDKHLKEIDDTISEQDLKNVKTEVTTPGTPVTATDAADDLVDETTEINDENEPEKEAPSSWEILNE